MESVPGLSKLSYWALISIKITPRAICSMFLRHSKFSIVSILFLPKNNDLILGTPSRFSIFLILLDPISSISSSGKSRF